MPNTFQTSTLETASNGTNGGMSMFCSSQENKTAPAPPSGWNFDADTHAAGDPELLRELDNLIAASTASQLYDQLTSATSMPMDTSWTTVDQSLPAISAPADIGVNPSLGDFSFDDIVFDMNYGY